MAPPAVASVKTIAETPNLASIPSSYIFSANDGAAKAAPRGVEDSIPTIDFSLLTMGTPDQRAKVVDELGKACQDWGFFVRDIGMVGCREILEEYCKRSIEMARELVRGISESLGLETCHLERAVDFESCSTLFAANFYPPYPQPELARGLPSHSDQCLLTLLLQNQISGLQILHQGNWVDVNPIPNSFLVNVADQLEILSNGKYKSVLHRAMVNNKATRLSIAVAVGSSPETVVSPAPQLLNKLTNPPLFKHIKYTDYMQMVQSSNLQDSCLDRIRLL